MAAMFMCFLVALLSVPGTYGQGASASCSTTYDWTHNSEGQDPCLIAARLQYPCVNSYDVGQPMYVGPANEAARPCTCNTVLYSTLAACAVCQGAGQGGVVPWSAFSQHCPNVAIQQYPELLSHGTSIPTWAYLPLLNDTFDVRAAQFLVLLGPAGSTETSTNHSTLSNPLGETPSIPPSGFTSPSGPGAGSDALFHKAHLTEGSMLIGMMVGGALLLSMAITSTIISARRLHALSVPPQTSPLIMTTRPAPMPRLRMPTLPISSLRLPAFKLWMPALLRMLPRLRIPRLPVFKLRVPAWRKRGHDSEASWIIGTPSIHEALNDPDGPPTFPPLPSPADVYFYRCHQKALDVMGCERPASYTDVSVTSTVGSVELYSPPTMPLRGYGYHWRSKCATV